MAISNCLFSTTSENPRGFSVWCVLAKLTAKPRNYLEPRRLWTIEMNERIQIRFFIDYGAGCLWSGNEAARNKFGVGSLNTTIYDLNGEVAQEPAIKLPVKLELINGELIELYHQSLNDENPDGESLWDESQWTSYLVKTESLFNQIAEYLGYEIELINEQKTGFNN